MFTKILSGIIALLLVVFPGATGLLATQQQLSFPGEKAVREIITEAIKEKDASALEELYSKEVKQNSEGLNESLSA